MKKLLALGLCCILNGTPAAAVVCPSSPIKLAVYQAGSLYDNGVGLDQDVVDELRQRTGCQFKVEVMPRARIWKALAEGDLDMTVSGIETPERTKFAYFLPYLQQKYMVLLTEPALAINNMEAFMAAPVGMRMGAVRSFTHGAYYDLWMSRLADAGRLELSADPLHLFKMFKEQRFVAMLSLPLFYRKYLPQMDMEYKVTVNDWQPGEAAVKHCLVLARHRFSASDAKRWAATVDGMRKDGTMERLLGRYLHSYEVAAALVR